MIYFHYVMTLMPEIISIDHILPGRTPFNVAALNHRWAGYIGSRERRAMNDMALDGAKTAHPETSALVESLKLITNEYTMWDMVIKHLQNPVTANTHMELIMASCDVIPIYGLTEDDNMSLPRYDLSKQGKDLEKYQLTGWYLNPVPRDLTNLRTFVSEQIRHKRKMMKQRLAKQFSDTVRFVEEQRKLNLNNREWLLEALADYGVKTEKEAANDDYPIQLLCDMLLKAEAQEENEHRLATMAPLPDPSFSPVFD